MGAMLFKLLVSREKQIQRVFSKFQPVDSSTLSPSSSPQMVRGIATSDQDIIAPLSGKKCIFYHVEAWELYDRNDKVDWHIQFEESKAVPFVLNDIYFGEDKAPFMTCLFNRYVEIHTGEDAFPALEFGDDMEVTSHAERVMVFNHDASQDSDGVLKDEVPDSLKDLLLRNRFDLYLVNGEPKHKRMKFIEKYIEAGSNTNLQYIGIIQENNDVNPSGCKRFKMEPVCCNSTLCIAHST